MKHRRHSAPAPLHTLLALITLAGASGITLLLLRSAADMSLQRWVLLGLLTLCPAAFAWTVVRLMTWPQAELACRLRETADEARLGTPLVPRTCDEVGELTRELDELRRRLLSALEDNKALLHEAEEADRYKTRFMDSVSHELRTPLNAILGFAQILLQELDGPLTEGQREDVRIIETSGRYLLNLFNDVLDLSAMASGQLTLERGPVQVETLMQTTADMLEGLRRDRPVAIQVEVEPGLPPLDGERKRLRQILMNLATNALKYTERGSVTLEAARAGEQIKLSVRDTGIGIQPEELERIFEEFEQAGARRRRRAGVGLGLAICKRLTELHGGSIHVRSTPAEGSVFHVVLPRWKGRSA